MATRTVTRPVVGASRVGTIDPMGPTRVYTDETLRVVAAGSADAAFVWKRGELERRKARREELGLDKNDEALRVQIDSRKVELANAERRQSALNDQTEALRDAAKVFASALREAANEPTSQEPEKLTSKALDELVAELGLELPPKATADDKRSAIAEAEASGS